jgi:hypothetical protein
MRLAKLAQEALVFKWQDTGEAHDAILYQAAAPCRLPLVDREILSPLRSRKIGQRRRLCLAKTPVLEAPRHGFPHERRQACPALPITADRAALES